MLKFKVGDIVVRNSQYNNKMGRRYGQIFEIQEVISTNGGVLYRDEYGNCHLESRVREATLEEIEEYLVENESQIIIEL